MSVCLHLNVECFTRIESGFEPSGALLDYKVPLQHTGKSRSGTTAPFLCGPQATPEREYLPRKRIWAVTRRSIAAGMPHAHRVEALSAEQCPARRSLSRSASRALIMVAAVLSICEPCAGFSLSVALVRADDVGRMPRCPTAASLRMYHPEPQSRRRYLPVLPCGRAFCDNAPILRRPPCCIRSLLGCARAGLLRCR
jgi:hypothetical protein